MKKTPFTLTVFVLLSAGLALSSCKKDADTNTVDTAKLLGDWNLREYGEDLNHNKTLDAAEAGPISNEAQILKISGNNTYAEVWTDSTRSYTQTGTYTVANN
jgi:hypothetical protein